MVISGTASTLSGVSFRRQNWEKMLKTFALLFFIVAKIREVTAPLLMA
jgi:hypothetical protein